MSINKKHQIAFKSLAYSEHQDIWKQLLLFTMRSVPDATCQSRDLWYGRWKDQTCLTTAWCVCGVGG